MPFLYIRRKTKCQEEETKINYIQDVATVVLEFSGVQEKRQSAQSASLAMAYLRRCCDVSSS